MALVDYSESDSDPDGRDRTQGKHASKRQRGASAKRDSDRITSLPPLPKSFHDLYASSVRTGTSDDPSLHGGRKRAVPHIEGNWSTHVYLEWWPTPTERALLEEAITEVRKSLSAEFQIRSHLTSDLGTALPLHISLSRPVIFSTENKDSFEEHLSNAIANVSLKPFTVTTTHTDWVSNWDQTRWFLVLRLAKPEANALNDLLNTINEVIARFGQPKLYEDSVAISNSSRRKNTKTEVSGIRPNPTTSPSPQQYQYKSFKPPPQRSSSSFPSPLVSSNPLTNTKKDFTQHFHISIAWSLASPFPLPQAGSQQPRTRTSTLDTLREGERIGNPSSSILIPFSSVKIKIGNTVTDVPFRNTGGIGWETEGFGRR